MAAQLFVGDGSALSHECAAVLLGFWKRKVFSTNLVVDRRLRSRSDIAVHFCGSLNDLDYVQHESGLRTTSVARTLLDLGERMHYLELANVIHEADFIPGRVDVNAVEDVINRNRHSKAATVLRSAFDIHIAGEVGFKSTAERDFYFDLAKTSLPLPKVNYRASVLGGSLEVDFCWPDRMIVVEVDGFGHRRNRTKDEDARRDELLRRSGFYVMRCTRETFAATIQQLYLHLNS